MPSENKPRSGSSRRSGLAEYEDKGRFMAIKYLGVGKRPKTLTNEGVRQAIDSLPGKAELQTTVADFWLGLAKAEGRDRRKTQPPTNPFKKAKTSFLAPKSKIEEWELAWRSKEAARVMGVSRVPKVREVANQLRYQHTWIFEGKKIIGFAEQAPVDALNQALARPELLSIQELSLEDALRKPWKDPVEQRYWIERLQHAHRALEAELEGLVLEGEAASKPLKRKEGRGGL